MPEKKLLELELKLVESLRLLLQFLLPAKLSPNKKLLKALQHLNL